MENNKILIDIQFTKKASNKIDEKAFIDYYFEIFVLKDITFGQLLDGIKYGLRKMKKNDPDQQYSICSEIFDYCINQKSTGYFPSEIEYYNLITLTSYSPIAEASHKRQDGYFRFSDSDFSTPISQLGFITSSRLIFDYSGVRMVGGKINTDNIVEAFNPANNSSKSIKKYPKITFPEFNISTRELPVFDDTSVKIIPPSEPPQKPDRGIISLLLPSLISVMVLVVVRSFFMNGNGSTSIILLSVAMGLSSVLLTVFSFFRQKKQYNEKKENWRKQYEDYIKTTISLIKKRKNSDSRKLEKLYPDVSTLIGNSSEGVFSLNHNIFSKVAADSDFLSFRIGLSHDVDSFFPIEAEEKEVVFSTAGFRFVKSSDTTDEISIVLRDESDFNETADNLCRLPIVLKAKYQKLDVAPLIYSLKTKRSLGIVDYSLEDASSLADFFVERMIFELCYYHSPENLQFVVFFPFQNDSVKIEKTIQKYKFMPHFRSLFDDKSQFVFDNKSAASVMSSLFAIMQKRRENYDNKQDFSIPHIVLILFDEHGLKEHSFAEFLPEAVPEGVDVVNYGLSFVFVKQYREYLPSYCDDVIYLTKEKMTIIPRDNALQRKSFWLPIENDLNNTFFYNYDQKLSAALRFFSAVYYSKVMQDAKVPSLVDLFELFADGENHQIGEKEIKALISVRWKKTCAVTKSLSVPIGKTGIGIVSFDIHERAAGPHMLVAGKTGSGKTETIITYLLGLCMSFSPEELNLLLVDMKGGGFTNRLGMLPHVVGKITDVEGVENETGSAYMLSRFLDSLVSEIERRKLLLNKMHVDNVDDYILACSNVEKHLTKVKNLSSDPVERNKEIATIRTLAESEHLAHLILVVDEFTELKRFSTENNDVDYISEITTIARVGRSLGIHIILISQNIEGAITDDIRVNCSTRLCLKVATAQASKEMIGTAAAASPSMPGFGRAYLSENGGAKLEYFQSGYSKIASVSDIPVSITMASKTGEYISFYESTEDNDYQRIKSSESETQIDIAIRLIKEAFDKGHYNKPHQVFLPPLPTSLYY